MGASAYRMIDALATADPSNRDYQQSLAKSLAWYADAEGGDAGHLEQRVALGANVGLLTRLAGAARRCELSVAADSRGASAWAICYAMSGTEWTWRVSICAPPLPKPSMLSTDRTRQHESGSGIGARARNDLAEFLAITGSAARGALQQNEAACSTSLRGLIARAEVAGTGARLARLLDGPRAIGRCQAGESRMARRDRRKSSRRSAKADQRRRSAPTRLSPLPGLPVVRRRTRSGEATLTAAMAAWQRESRLGYNVALSRPE